MKRTSGIEDTFRGKWIGYANPLTEEQKEYIEKLKAVINRKTWCLVVSGTYGNGKTYLAKIAVNTFNDDGYRGGYYTTQALIQSELRSDTRENTFKRLCGYPLLVIDEMSARPTDWTEFIKTTIESILIERHAQGLLTILIGNVRLEEFVQMFDVRVRDRLKEGLVMVMNGPSLRKAIGEK